MATTFASVTSAAPTTNNTTNSAIPAEIRTSMNINRVPLVSAQTTNCDQAISAKQLYLDQSIRMSDFKNEKKQIAFKSTSTVGQSINRIENLPTNTTATIDNSTKTTSTINVPTSQASSSNRDDRPNLVNDSQSKTDKTQTQVRNSNCQINKSKSNPNNRESAIKITSSCTNKASSSSSSLSLSSSSSSSSASSSSSSSSSASSATNVAACSSRALNFQTQNQSYQLQYQEEFYKMRERLFRMLSKVPIRIETEPSLSWQQHLQRLNSSPVQQSSSASSSAQSSATSASSASSTSSCSRSTSSRKLDQEALIIKYYNDRSLKDILEQHFGCALINHNFVLGLALDSQHQNQQRPLENRPSLDDSGNFSHDHQHQYQQSAYCKADESEVCRESLEQQQQNQANVEQCLDWQNSYNLSWQTTQHGTFDLAIPSTVQLRTAPNLKKVANQKRSMMNTVKDELKYAPNTNLNQRQQAKRQRLSNPARQHQSIAPSPSPNVQMDSIRSTAATNGRAKIERQLSTTFSGRTLPLSLVEYQPIPSGKLALKELEDEDQQEPPEQQQLFLVHQIHGKSAKYTSSAPGLSPSLNCDQHSVFENNFIASRPPVNTHCLLLNQETRTSCSELHGSGQCVLQSQQQLNTHNHLNNNGQLQEQESELHNLYQRPSYSQHHVRQVEPRSDDQISISNCFEPPHQLNLDHQLNQHFEQREPDSCYVTSPQLADQQQQQQQFLADHPAYYQPQATYLHAEPQSEWPCHAEHLPSSLSHPQTLPLPHQQHHQNQQNSSSNMNDMSQEQQLMIDQRQQQQPGDGLLSESYSVRRHNFAGSQTNSPYHLEPTYSLVYQPDCNAAQLNVSLTANNPGQQLLLIDETSQQLNHSVGQLSQLLN